MDNIIEPTSKFDFSKLSLAHPVGIQGGAYFTKILHNNKPLYIQTTKSLTRQGFVKTGKKYYCDLMFDNNSETLVNWFENLEETCQNLIFDKSELWFQNSLEKSDVESAFNSSIRIYKSGKYYLVRTNVKIGTNNEPYVKIYNENQVNLSIDDVKEETNIISILEIQGIKFTSRNFQMDIELKQVMVLDNEPLFDNCLIKTNNNTNKNSLPNQIEKQDEIIINDNKHMEPLEKNDSLIEPDCDSNIIDDAINTPQSNTGSVLALELDLANEINVNNNNESHKSDNETEPHEDNSEINFDIQELSNDELKEMDLDFNHLENDLESIDNETIVLKKPNEVYYELYREARGKAKLAKRNAIIAYLEAKNIKKTYMLDNLDENESDIDAEIDDVSESELEEI